MSLLEEESKLRQQVSKYWFLEEILALTGNLGFNRKSWLAQEILGFFELFATSVDHPVKFLSNG